VIKNEAVNANPRSGRHRLIGLLFLLFVAIACDEGVNGPTGPSQGLFRTTPSGEPVVREILAQMDSPPGAPGRRLTLVRYTIAPAAQLAPHIHPGVQVASITSGILTYEIVSGTVTIQRNVGPNGVPASTEQLTGPARTTLGRGDVVFEEGQMVHFGANTTSEAVVIAATLITEAGADLAVAVPVAAQ
jgi:quercetin dioxygenase-like cupin family protein